VTALSVCALASVALALLSVVGTASATMPTIGPPVPQLTSLAKSAVHLLDMHLSPAYSLPYDIGWQTNAVAGATSPANTNAYLDGHGCQIAVDQAVFDSATKGNSDWELEIVTHEVFHCYEQQLEGNADHMVTKTEPWLQEGLARWVDIELFSSDPVSLALDTLKTYFATSKVSLFARSYDAVGFWGHLQDLSRDLWTRIPHILTKAPGGSQAALDEALSGISEEEFFDTWGSSAANLTEGGEPWTARSPDPDAGFSAPVQTIKPAGPDSPVPVALDQDSTDQLHITVPAAPAGDIETVRIDLGLAYGRFGVKDNYTGSKLDGMTFCGGPSGCKASKAPPGGGCGAGEVSVPPPPLTPLPSDAMLGVAAAATRSIVTVDYHAVSVERRRAVPASQARRPISPDRPRAPGAAAVIRIWSTSTVPSSTSRLPESSRW